MTIWEIDNAPKPVEGVDEHGRPDPAYAQSLGLISARPGMRVLATMVEVLIALLLATPAVLVATPIVLSLASGELDPARLFARGDLILLIVITAASNLLVLIYTIVQLVLHGRKGVTVGKAMFGIRSINVRTFEPPGFWRGAVVRYLLIGASFLVPLVGPLLVITLSPLFDAEKRGRGWLDKAATTWFVDVRRGQDPFDAKRMRIARKQLTAVLHEEQVPLPSLATPLDQNVPDAYVPSARFSGGVLGARRMAGTDVAAPAGPAGPAGPAAAPAAHSNSAPVAPVAPAPAPSADPFSVAPAGHAAAIGMITGVPSLTPVAPRAAPAPVPPPVPVAPPVAPQTVASSQVAAPSAPAPAPAARAVIVLDSGDTIDVRSTVLIGRAPHPADGEGAVQLVPLADDSRSVSKTHLAIMPTRRGLLAVDRGSTNGSSVLRDGAETPLAPGMPVQLLAGDTVRFGDRMLRVHQA